MPERVNQNEKIFSSGVGEDGSFEGLRKGMQFDRNGRYSKPQHLASVLLLPMTEGCQVVLPVAWQLTAFHPHFGASPPHGSIHSTYPD